MSAQTMCDHCHDHRIAVLYMLNEHVCGAVFGCRSRITYRDSTYIHNMSREPQHCPCTAPAPLSLVSNRALGRVMGRVHGRVVGGGLAVWHLQERRRAPAGHLLACVEFGVGVTYGASPRARHPMWSFSVGRCVPVTFLPDVQRGSGVGRGGDVTADSWLTRVRTEVRCPRVLGRVVALAATAHVRLQPRGSVGSWPELYCAAGRGASRVCLRLVCGVRPYIPFLCLDLCFKRYLKLTMELTYAHAGNAATRAKRGVLFSISAPSRRREMSVYIPKPRRVTRLPVHEQQYGQAAKRSNRSGFPFRI